MADRLTDIKNMVEEMDGAFTAQLFGYEMNEKTLIEDYKWLIEQAETLRKIANTWVAIETNGTSEDADNFYTIVQDILSPKQEQ